MCQYPVAAPIARQRIVDFSCEVNQLKCGNAVSGGECEELSSGHASQCRANQCTESVRVRAIVLNRGPNAVFKPLVYEIVTLLSIVSKLNRSRYEWTMSSLLYMTLFIHGLCRLEGLGA